MVRGWRELAARWRRSSITGQTMILTLQAGNVSLALAGGKGANLARLLGASFSVPGGFIITTRAYHAYVAANNLENWIIEAARSARPDDPATLDEASRAIRARFDAGVMPPTLADAIGHAYAAIGCPPVAVRSSATTEDLPEASFAGQQGSETGTRLIQASCLNEPRLPFCISIPSEQHQNIKIRPRKPRIAS